MSSRNEITVKAKISLVDHETFGDNEHGEANDSKASIVTSDQESVEVLNMQGTAGGEMRVEFKLRATVREDGYVIINGIAELFEGITEQTMDLDGTVKITPIIVPKNTTSNSIFRIYNADEGDDYADIKIQISNMQVSSVQEQRSLVTKARISLVDHETFVNNEYGHAHQTRLSILSVNQPVEILDMQRTAGGEMRVELKLEAKLTENGDISINGTADLFEGITEQTDDHDGHINISCQVLKNEDHTFISRIHNEDEGNDYADIQIKFTNTDFPLDSPLEPNKVRSVLVATVSGSSDGTVHPETEAQADALDYYLHEDSWPQPRNWYRHTGDAYANTSDQQDLADAISSLKKENNENLSSMSLLVVGKSLGAVLSWATFMNHERVMFSTFQRIALVLIDPHGGASNDNNSFVYDKGDPLYWPASFLQDKDKFRVYHIFQHDDSPTGAAFLLNGRIEQRVYKYVDLTGRKDINHNNMVQQPESKEMIKKALEFAWLGKD